MIIYVKLVGCIIKIIFLISESLWTHEEESVGSEIQRELHYFKMYKIIIINVCLKYFVDDIL